MPQVRCPNCGHTTGFAEGMEKVFCEMCDYEMTIHYKVEKIVGDPVSYLLVKRAEPKSSVETENIKGDKTP